MELTIAELACVSDFNCISVVDDGCDGHSPFHLCRKLSDTSGENMLRCTTYHEKEGIKCLVYSTYSKFFDFTTWMKLSLYIFSTGDENVRKISQYDDASVMTNIDDRYFRFSGSLHGIDWKKVAKSTIPHLNDDRINYMMSLAGAVSLNPLILITGIIVDDTLSQSPTIIGARSFYQALNQYAEKLIRSHLEYEVHPKYNQALVSIWKTFCGTLQIVVSRKLGRQVLGHFLTICFVNVLKDLPPTSCSHLFSLGRTPP